MSETASKLLTCTISKEANGLIQCHIHPSFEEEDLVSVSRAYFLGFKILLEKENGAIPKKAFKKFMTSVVELIYNEPYTGGVIE